MMPAANQGVGMNMGFPDVCLTPAGPAPVPIPYPNMGMNAMAMPFIPNIMVSMAPAQNMAAKPLMTNGDNAGVAHPMVMMPGGTLMGNPRILMGGMPAAHLTVPTYGNNFNEPVGAKLVPSVTNVLLGSLATWSPREQGAAMQALFAGTGSSRRTAHGLVLRPLCLGLATERWLDGELARAAAHGVCRVVLDLCGNPGGAVRVAQRLAARLLTADLTLAVACDRRTASAAELLAALLQDLGRVPVFGERTFGKGMAQRFACAGDGARPAASALPLRRCGGARLDDRGTAPDFACASSEAVAAATRWLATGGRIPA